MPRGVPAFIAALVSVLPGAAADAVEWGQPANGIRMSIGIDGFQIDVRLQNTGTNTVLVPVGMAKFPIYLKLRLRMPGGATPNVFYTGAFVAGYPEPMTVILQDGEVGTVVTPASMYYAVIMGSTERLTTFIRQRCELWAELDVNGSECTNPPKNPTPNTQSSVRRTAPCWRGSIVSNVLQLPQ